MQPSDLKQHFHESNLIEGFDDPAFDLQMVYAWERMMGIKKLKESDVRAVQKILTLKQPLQPDWRGYYRKIPVTVGGHEVLQWWLIPAHMEAWVHRVNEWEQPRDAHIGFEHIHPFVDGNGRTGRMLMWWHEIRLGMKPTLILNSEKYKYYKWFKEDNRG